MFSRWDICNLYYRAGSTAKEMDENIKIEVSKFLFEVALGINLFHL